VTIQQLIDTLRARHVKAQTQEASDRPSGANDLHGWRTAMLDAISARTVQALGKRMGNATWEGIPRVPGR